MADDRRDSEEDEEVGGTPEGEPVEHPGETHRENVPGELAHSSASVDEAEASIVAGAGGVPADDLEVAQRAFERDEERRAQRAAAAAVPGAPTTGGGSRVINFLRASWAELQRVQWPDRQQVGQATAVVLGFVIVAGTYLGIADEVAQRIVDVIL